MKRVFLFILVVTGLFSLVCGCAGNKASGTPANGGQAAATVAQVAADVPTLAKQLDGIYEFWVQQKAIPDHTAEATRVLASLDAIAPMVQQGAQACAGDNFNWAQFTISAALTAAQAAGYILPLVL